MSGRVYKKCMADTNRFSYRRVAHCQASRVVLFISRHLTTQRRTGELCRTLCLRVAASSLYVATEGGQASGCTHARVTRNVSCSSRRRSPTASHVRLHHMTSLPPNVAWRHSRWWPRAPKCAGVFSAVIASLESLSPIQSLQVFCEFVNFVCR